MAEALIICRFFHFSAAMLLFGTSAFTGMLAPAGLRASLVKPLRPFLIIATLVAAATTVIWLGLETGEIGSGWSDAVSPDMLGAVLSDTWFGQVWTWRLVLAAVLAGALFLKPGFRRYAVLGLSALLLATLALVGHAAMLEGVLGWGQRLNEAVHLIAAGFWLGCLPPLLLCLVRLRDPALRSEAAKTLRRFSGLGHVAVALVLLTGVVNVALILGKLPLDFASPYQFLLAVKIGLVALMVGIAVINRYVTVPRLSNKPAALRFLVAGTLGELAIGAVIIALVSAFATFDPM